MGQAKILKRGEELTPQSAAKKKDPVAGDVDLILCSTDRLGSEPETIQREIKVPDLKSVDGLYSGSMVFLSSPPPSSLPFQAFRHEEGPERHGDQRSEAIVSVRYALTLVATDLADVYVD